MGLGSLRRCSGADVESDVWTWKSVAVYSDDKTKLRRLVSRNSDVGKADCLAGKAIEPNKSGVLGEDPWDLAALAWSR